ncbi:hypothetical protein CHS0354_014545 [Potamilus streckersoni]|uniref:Replication protein A 70 kDa DNA-binding subunit n=1 Tax=Potamilus streckersoni TaxID=2493646 RepID=A0AAE0VT34_9BIVA|nr:hypothetical protein CHS0354_014545 [Potamilus streckersoni]
MKSHLWMKIQSQWNTIIRDIHVSTVLDNLMGKLVISFDEYEAISKQETESKKARRLLEILKYKDDQHYYNFLAALDENEYGKIADAIREAEVPQDFLELGNTSVTMQQLIKEALEENFEIKSGRQVHFEELVNTVQISFKAHGEYFGYDVIMMTSLENIVKQVFPSSQLTEMPASGSKTCSVAKYILGIQRKNEEMTIQLPSLEVNAKQDTNVTSVTKSFSTPNGQQKETYQRIASLTPSLTSWKIRARVTMKGERATKRKKNNAGRYNTTKYFHLKVADESGEIEGVVFNDAVDKFYNVLKMGKVFCISEATLEEANKKYNSTKHDYHIVINKDANIKPCQDTGDISPYGEFDFITIDKLKDSREGELVDIIAVVKECGQSETVKTKKGKNKVKREIQLVDQSGMQVGLTIWESDAVKFLGRRNSILALKGVMVSEWGGRSLTKGLTGQMIVDPIIPKAEELHLWFISKGKQMDFTSFR